tara:strand:+ start:295 stop:591 length:297 start_codon:yes stop_codon:yes gene_type:complete
MPFNKEQEMLEDNPYANINKDCKFKNKFEDLNEKFFDASEAAQSKPELMRMTEKHINNLKNVALAARLEEQWDIRKVIVQAIDTFQARLWKKKVNGGY